MAEMRASQLKDDLLALGVLGDAAAARILAELPPAHLRAIERAARADWLPIEVDVALCRVIHAVTGDEGIRRWGREALRRSVDSSILRPLVGAVTRVFGLSPASLLKALPQAWRATFRDCGELTIHVGPGGPQIRLVGLAAQLQDRAFQLSISGSLEVIFDLSRTEGRIQLVEPSSGPEARYTVTWQGA